MNLINLETIILDLEKIGIEALQNGNLNAAISAKKAIAEILMKQKQNLFDFNLDELSEKEFNLLCNKVDNYLKNIENKNNEKNNF